jgi:hypothetical protein
MLVTFPNPHPGAIARLSTFKVRQTRERAPILCFHYFHLRFTFESIKEVGSVSFVVNSGKSNVHFIQNLVKSIV